MTNCEDCGDEAKRRSRCKNCGLLVCAHCKHHIHDFAQLVSGLGSVKAQCVPATCGGRRPAK